MKSSPVQFGKKMSIPDYKQRKNSWRVDIPKRGNSLDMHLYSRCRYTIMQDLKSNTLMLALLFSQTADSGDMVFFVWN